MLLYESPLFYESSASSIIISNTTIISLEEYMTDLSYTYLPDIQEMAVGVQPDSILSRTLSSSESLKVILFGFAEGQELSQHTSSKQAILHFLSGEARLVLGEDELEARPGTWVRMDPNLPHSVFARTPVTMLLIML